MKQSTSFAQVATNQFDYLSSALCANTPPCKKHSSSRKFLTLSISLRLLFVMFVALTVSANVWGADVTIKVSSDTWTNTGTSGSGGTTKVSKSGVTVSSDKGYKDGTTAIREYSGGDITVSSNDNITKIVFTSTANKDSKYGPNCIALKLGSAGTYTTLSNSKLGTWTGTAKSITFTCSAQFRWTQVVVTTASATKYTVTLVPGSGSVTNTELEGASIDLPTPTLDCGDWEFAGWKTTSAVTTETTTEPTLIAAGTYKPASNITLYAVYQRTEETEGGDSTPTEVSKTYTFSEYEVGTQYAEETYELDDDVTINIKGCHINTQLRVYGGQPGIVISEELPGRIVSMGFNMGYKADNLVVSGSTDGTSWNEVGRISTTTSYKDYTLDFEETNYTYFKLNVEGSNQIRIAKMSITYESTSGGGSSSTTYYHSTPECITETVITLNPNGGTGSMADVTTENGTLTLPKCTFTREGYTFAGWATSASGEVAFADEEVVSNWDADITELFAKWTAKTITITWDANGGSVNPTTSTYTYNGTPVELPIPTRANYTFNGWFTAASGGTQVTEVGTTNKPTEDVTYYAQWTSNKTATSLSWSAATYSATIDVDNTFPTLTKSPADLSPIAYSSSNTGVATIDENGNITLLKKGETTITATFEETATHTGATASYTLTVHPSNCRWVETEINDIEATDEVVIAMQTSDKTYAMYINDDATATPDATVVEPSDLTSASGIATGSIWFIEKDGNEKLIIHPKKDIEKNLYCNPSTDNDRVRVGKSHDNHKLYKTFEIDGNYLKNSVTQHYIGVNFTHHLWYGYANNSNFPNQTLKFYKRECLDATSYWVEGNFTNVTCDTQLPQQLATDGSITLTFTAADGYALPNDVTVNGATKTWDKANGKLTISDPTDNVMVTVSAVELHTITWMADGSTHDEATYLDGETLALPTTNPDPCQGSEFVGWTAEQNYSHATDAPAYISAGSIVNADEIYYAVYAEAPEGEEDATYTLVTTANDFTDGIYVIAAKSNDYFYFINGQYVSDGLGVETTGLASNLVNDNSFAASFLPGGAVELDIEDDGDPLGDNYYFISYYDEVNSKWLYLDDNGTKQTILWTDADEVYTYLPIFDNGKYYLQSGSGAKISQNGSNKASFIRNYASTGSFYNSLYFFKKSAGSIIYTNYSTTCTPTYYITYDLNGGEGGCENGSVPADENYTICANIPTKTGYDFVGWSTADDNEAEFPKADVEAGQAIIENVSNNVELYAVWEAKTYTIIWMSNGEEYVTTTHTYDQPLLIADAPYNCYGAKTFMGWTETPSVNENGEGITYIEESTNPSENKTYYAVFADEVVGEPKEVEATLSFANKAQRTSFSSTQQVWEQNGITLTNTRGKADNDAPVADYVNPARFYANSSISIQAPGNIIEIVFACSADSYVTPTKNSVGNSATSDGNNVAVELNASSNTFDIAKVTAQIRLSSLTVTYQSTPETTYSNYTTTPSGCPEIEVAENAYVTSAKDQSVKVNVPVKANNFANDMTITAAVEDGNFSVANVSAVTDGACTVTLAYKPTASNTTESATVTLTAKADDNEVTSTTFTVNGRSLPETFAVVAKVGGVWYALLSQGLNSTTPPAAYPVEVDNLADPTAVTAVPANADWSLRQVYASSGSNDRFADNGEKLVFVNDANPQKALNAGSTGNYLLTDARYDGYHTTTTPGLYEWTPTTTDLKTYTLTNAQRTDRTLNVATNTVFGVHSDNKATTEVRFLPITGRYTPAALQVVEWKENSVVIMYNGDPAQTASVSVNGGAVQTTELSGDGVPKDIAVYELAANGLATNPTQSLSITIGSEKVILPIPYIVGGDLDDATLLGGDELTIARRQEIAKISDLVILNGGSVTAERISTNYYKFRNVTIYGGGSLIIPAGKGFGANTLTMRVGGVENRQYKNLYPQLQLKGTLNNTSGQINLDYLTTNDFYYPLSVPYSVKISDIQYPVDIYGANVTSNNTGSFQFKYYDGAERAAGKTGWIVLDETANPTLNPNTGYAIWGIPKKVKVNGGESTRQKFGIHRLPLKQTAANMMTSEQQPHSATINVYNGSKRDSDNGWNYLGNPYLSHYGDFTTADNVMKLGKLVWDEAQGAWLPKYTEQRYVVFTNDCQNYTAELASTTDIPAFSAFFIQADQGGAINFTSPNVATPQSLAARRSEEETKEITTGIILSGEKHSDRTGLLIADQFTEAYEFNADLSKFDNQDMNLYTISSSGKLAFMAINEDLAKQTIPLGYSVSTDGMYSIAFDEQRYSRNDIYALYLIDYDRNETTNLLHMDYNFYSETGAHAERFALQVAFAPNTSTEVEYTQVGNVLLSREGNTLRLDNLPSDATVTVYDAVGHLVEQHTASQLLQLTLQKGYYLLHIGNNQNSVVIDTFIP